MTQAEMTESKPAVVVAGIGNLLRGDDGVGPLIAHRLQDVLPQSVMILVGLDDPLELIELWDGAEMAIVVDAVVSGAPPGTVHVLDDVDDLPAMFHRLSTHLFSVAQVIELGRVMDRTARKIVVIGIEAGSMDPGQVTLSPAVSAAVGEVIQIVRDLVASCDTSRVPGSSRA